MSWRKDNLGEFDSRSYDFRYFDMQPKHQINADTPGRRNIKYSHFFFSKSSNFSQQNRGEGETS